MRDASSWLLLHWAVKKSLSENKCLLELQAGCRLEKDALGGAEAGLCECEAEMEGSDDEGIAGADCPEAEVRSWGLFAGASCTREKQASNKKTASVMAHPSDATFALSESSAEDAVSWNMFRKYHQKKRQFCCSGKKQLRVVQALFDDDQLKGLATKPRYLRRSAAILRNSLGSMNHAVNHLDRGYATCPHRERSSVQTRQRCDNRGFSL